MLLLFNLLCSASVLYACVIGLSKPLQAPDLPSRLLLDSVVCLLRTVVVGMAMHCHSLNSRHTRSVSSLLHHLLQSGAKTGTVFSPFCDTSLHLSSPSLFSYPPPSLSLSLSQMIRSSQRWPPSNMTPGSPWVSYVVWPLLLTPVPCSVLLSGSSCYWVSLRMLFPQFPARNNLTTLL